MLFCNFHFSERKFNKHMIPYNTKMDSYNHCNIECLARNCEEWDEVNSKEFETDAGERVREITKTKSLGDDRFLEEKSMFVYDIQLSKGYSMNRSSSGSYDEFDNNTDCPITRKLVKKVREYKSVQRDIQIVQPIFDKIFSEGSPFPVHKCDETIKVLVTNMVSFGDFKDAQNTKPQKQEVGGTIVGYINTVRPFKPGYYYVTIIVPFTGCDPFVIYHHENVDAAKIMNKIILMCQDFTGYYRDLRNSINRYDWCHYRNWGGPVDESEESDNTDSDYSDRSSEKSSSRSKCSPLDKNTIFFCPSELAGGLNKAVRGSQLANSKVAPEVNAICGTQGSYIALATDVSKFNSGDWIYGKVFQDRVTRENFALVVVLCMGDLDDAALPEQIIKRYPDREFTSVAKTKLEFDVADFSYDQI